MNRQHSAPASRQRLAAQDAIARLNAQLPFGANMLFQRNNQPLRQWDLTQRGAVGLGFHFRRMNTAVEVPDFVFSKSGK